MVAFGTVLLIGLGLYLLRHQEAIDIDKALEEAIPNASERAMAKAMLNGEEAIKALTELTQHIAA